MYFFSMHSPRRRPLAALWLLPLLIALGLSPAVAQSGSSYHIGPKDLIEIRVFEVPTLNGQWRVSEDGTINFPPLGEVVVQGMTPQEFEAHLKKILEDRYFQRATVTVELREFRSSPISVIGAVKNPGDLAFPGRWTLIEALTNAGGLTSDHGAVVYVLRRAANGLSDQIEISLQDLLVRGDPDVNIPIFANDLINVPATVDYTIYCLGEVAQPGALVFKSTERITLLAAIARAGGMTDRASSKVLVKRNGPGGEQEVEVDYKRIVGGKETDFKLQDGDVVLVKESFF